jgi:hypothetical protein
MIIYILKEVVELLFQNLLNKIYLIIKNYGTKNTNTLKWSCRTI